MKAWIALLSEHAVSAAAEPGLPAGRCSSGHSSVTAAGSSVRAAGGVASLIAAAAAVLRLATVRW